MATATKQDAPGETGQGLHHIKVCIVQKDNPKPIIKALKALAEVRQGQA